MGIFRIKSELNTEKKIWKIIEKLYKTFASTRVNVKTNTRVKMCEHAHRSFQVLLYKTITQVLRIISLSLIQKLRQAKNRLQDHSSSQNLVMLWSLIILIMHYCISDKDKKESSYLSHRAVLQVQMSRFPLQSYIISIHRTLYFGCDCKREFE